MDWPNRNLENQIKSIGGKRLLSPIDFEISDTLFQTLQINHSEVVLLPKKSLKLILSNDEHHHALNVLRLKENTPVSIFDPNKEIEAIGFIKVSEKNKAVIEVCYLKKSSYILPTFLVGLPKFKVAEKLVEKLTEIGVRNILFYIATRSELAKLDPEQINSKTQRLIKIRNSALKQCYSMNSPNVKIFPNIHETISWVEKNPMTSESLKNLAFLCHTPYNIESKQKLNKKETAILNPLDIINNYNLTSVSPIIAIGPEGGFSTEELEYYSKMHFSLLSLGQNVLRVETAASMACAIFGLHRMSEAR